MQLEHNPYISCVNRALPRILALFDRDPTSNTFGVGDRYYWAWKLIDFANGTFQGAAHGLARLLASSALPDFLDDDAVLRRIDEIFIGSNKLRRANGSMEEAFPYESSFCVTSLVAYDLLSAIEILTEKINSNTREKYLEVIRPMINYLLQAREDHAFISNHLATAAAALLKWHQLTGAESEKRGQKILREILNEQSDEGWFREYEGADPGYQTLCTYYLADIHRMRPDLQLLEPLRRSIRFLWHFVHPDGSFGGLYGSRNTRFFYPSGLEYIAKDIPEAKILVEFMRKSIAHQATVTLDSIDEPNLIPMFNSYCWAATQVQDAPLGKLTSKEQEYILPALCGQSWIRKYPKAGLVIASGPSFYTIISWHKGGVCYHFHNSELKIDAGLVVFDKQKNYFSTQGYQEDNDISIEGKKITVTARLTKIHRQMPTPLHLVVLRCLNVTLMRNDTICRLVKKMLVWLLITGKCRVKERNRRSITLGESFDIKDELQEEGMKYTRTETGRHFCAIHMASQGYWMRQDEHL